MTNEQNIADHLELRALVDRISVLADQKDYNAQVPLFTPDAVIEITVDGEIIMQLSGRASMVEAFKSFNQSFTASYHLNGQHLLKINGDVAEGTLYTQISLSSLKDGKKARTIIGAVYQDEYTRTSGKWLIKVRRGAFLWQEKAIIE
ncbi:nuclear transport factor 2 family protein [Mucilaginibacter pedocola]|uniref:SnoaL-like domain-containing protein n=1 Tax=Mucilaginibacter pedocola TaxID=1792845 RepID=A0A1S9PHH4_9SPHI|nr:nuclear transport factor 2 family protein [Mucilaginibacter pedocola]OOQ60393.1 hypothetical protein BC343_25580 [Mucilaginibacter pedocola]